MKELNWPKHLAAKPVALGRRGLAVAGVGVLLLGVGLTAWFTDGSTPAPTAPPPTPVTATAPPAATPGREVAINVPEAEATPPPTSADVSGPAPAPEASKADAKPGATAAPADWATVAIEELKSRAEANEIPAMEEMARRLVQGMGVVKDQQAGAGWLVRAAQLGSSQSAFNVGVMYERGFVVERDSTRAAEWYRKASDANVPMAKHNLALLLRDGKGSARNVPEAIVLLRAAAKLGMAASMFTLGDIYERGDAGAKDPAMALAWFAITAEFERQVSRGTDTPLIKTAMQRAQALQRTMTPAELERAQRLGQSEFKQIVDALSITATPQVQATDAPAQSAAPTPPADPPGWPATAGDQIRVVQQALFDLKLLREKPDGAMGPVTRAAIREFQRSASLRENGEPTKEVFGALKDALARRDTVANSPLPAPPPQAAPPQTAKTEPDKPEPPKPEAKAEPAKPAPARVDPPKPEPPKIVEDKPAPQVNIGLPPPPPPPPTSVDIAKADPNAWPAATADQVKAIQGILGELKFYGAKADGQLGPATHTAIRDYQRASGLKESGEPSKALFDSLKEMRGLMQR